MDFKKKLKARLHTAIAYIVLGLVMIGLLWLTESDNNYLSSMGLALVVIGIVRIRNYRIVTRSEESIKRQQIAESDERNIAIANKAKSIAFSTYIMLACVAVIVLQLMEKVLLVTVISGSVCAMLVIYWVSYGIIRKKW